VPWLKSIQSIDMKIQGVKLQGTKLVPSGDVVNSDTYFNLVSLLLPGNGANGAQNNTFLDSSTNNYTITETGDINQGSFSPFSPTGWSANFDGTTDYISLANNAALNPGTDNFVMECWINITGTTGNNQGINGKGTAGSNGYSFYITNALVLSFVWNGTGGATITAGTLTYNTWNHVAVVRNSGVIRLYLNGVGAESSSACTTDITSTSVKYIGQARGGNPIEGYISNYRMIKGSLPAGYDATEATLPVPTAPFTNVSGTSVLTCQSNRFIDNSTNAFAITVTNDSNIQSFSPFNPTTAYSAADMGGSVFCDGAAGNYLRILSANAIGTASFTIEMYVYMTSIAVSNIIWDNRLVATDSTAGIYIQLNTAGNLAIGTFNNASILESLDTVLPNMWNHIALVRNGTTLRLYVNGILRDTTTYGTNLSSTNITIGSNRSGVSVCSGYISCLRQVIGTAVYTSDFTPPTAPPTAIANTSLLCNFVDAGFVDATAKNIIQTQGNVQISTAQSKFGGSSMYFNATSGTRARIPASRLLYLNSETTTATNIDFTIEFWFYPTTVSAAFQNLIVRRASQTARGLVCNIQNNGVLFVAFGDSNTTDWNYSYTSDSGVLEANAWQYLAITRQNTTYRVFVDGILMNSASPTAFVVADDTVGWNFGNNPAGETQSPFNGYINDLRITPGLARYTANFTPLTAAFPTQ